MKTINIARDFSDTPGGRFKNDGPANGEDFRERFLVPHFAGLDKHQKLLIVLDGAMAYPTSFLDEAFGGLARRFGASVCLQTLEFVSKEDDELVPEIVRYIRSAGN